MKKLLIGLTLLLAGSIAGAQPYTGTRAATSGGITLLQANDGTWIHLIGNGVPVLTTFLGDAVPANTLYTNTATGANYFFSAGSWTLSSAGTASAVTPGVTTTTGCTNKFLIADASSLFNCDVSFVTSVTGSANGVFTVRKNGSGSSAFVQSTGTINSSNGIGAFFNYASTTGGTNVQVGLDVQLGAGAVTASRTEGIEVANAVAGTGTTLFTTLIATVNAGIQAGATATTTGTNVGSVGYASGGDISVGGYFHANTDKSNGTNVGVLGLASQTSGTPVVVGGYFGLRTTNVPTFVSSVLQLDNVAVAVPILLAQDNGVTVTQIRDGGAIAGKDAVGGTDSDTAGGILTLGGGLGTGTGAGGDVNVQRSPSIATGTTAQTAADAIYIRSQKKTLTAATATPFARINIGSGVAAIAGWCGGTVFYTEVANDASDFQSRSGGINFSLVDKAGTETCAFAAIPTEAIANSSGTTTLTFDTDVAGPTNGCDLRATGASSLTETTLALFYTVVLNGPCTVTPQ